MGAGKEVQIYLCLFCASPHAVVHDDNEHCRQSQQSGAGAMLSDAIAA